MLRIASKSVIALAKLVAYGYSSLGLFALVLGLGLLAGFWTLQEIGGGVIEKVMGPGFLVRLLLPFVLALRFTVQISALVLIVLGGAHLAGGMAFLQRWKIGRFVLIMLSGFYTVLLLFLAALSLFEDYRRALPAAAFMALHGLFLWMLLSRPVSGWVR